MHFCQIGGANANLQKVLDAFDSIKSKVCSPQKNDFLALYYFLTSH